MDFTEQMTLIRNGRDYNIYCYQNICSELANPYYLNM